MANDLLHNEKRLIEGLNQGLGLAFAQLMRAYYPVLLQFANGIVTDRALAEDIAEEAFIQLWNKHESFENLGSVRKFLWITARHDCLDALRTRDSHSKSLHKISAALPVADESSTLLRMIRAEVMSDIYAAIRELPEKMQQVFTMSYIDGLKNQEIAEQLQLAEQTVRNQKSRALEILRLRFKNNDFVIGLLASLSLMAR